MTAPKTKPRTSTTDANCGLAALRFVADLAQAVGRFQGPSAADLDAGLLAAALHVLEAEVCRLLADHSAPLAVQDQDRSRAASITRLRIPAAAVQKLGLILDRLTTNGRLSYCSGSSVLVQIEELKAYQHFQRIELLNTKHDLPQDPNGFILEEATPRPQRSRTLGIAELPTVQVCVHG